MLRRQHRQLSQLVTAAKDLVLFIDQATSLITMFNDLMLKEPQPGFHAQITQYNTSFIAFNNGLKRTLAGFDTVMGQASTPLSSIASLHQTVLAGIVQLSQAGTAGLPLSVRLKAFLKLLKDATDLVGKVVAVGKIVYDNVVVSLEPQLSEAIKEYYGYWQILYNVVQILLTGVEKLLGVAEAPLAQLYQKFMTDVLAYQNSQDSGAASLKLKLPFLEDLGLLLDLIIQVMQALNDQSIKPANVQVGVIVDGIIVKVRALRDEVKQTVVSLQGIFSKLQ